MLTRQHQITITRTLPNATPAALIRDVEEALENYENQRQMSPDAIPSAPETRARIQRIGEHLEAALSELVGWEGDVIVLGYLGAALDGTDEASASFAEQLLALKRTIDCVAGECMGPMSINGRPHHRRTRTHTRDAYLIPMLTAIAGMHGGLDLLGDYEDLDTACEFVKAVLNAADIPAPDSGDTRHGEHNQGRLRRQIKDAAKLIHSIIDK